MLNFRDKHSLSGQDFEEKMISLEISSCHLSTSALVMLDNKLGMDNEL